MVQLVRSLKLSVQVARRSETDFIILVFISTIRGNECIVANRRGPWLDGFNSSLDKTGNEFPISEGVMFIDYGDITYFSSTVWPILRSHFFNVIWDALV